MLSKILIPVVLMSVLSQSGSLSPEERAMVAFIDANNAAAIALLEKSVNINSGTQNFKGVQEVGTLFVPNLMRSGSRRRGLTAHRSTRRTSRGGACRHRTAHPPDRTP